MSDLIRRDAVIDALLLEFPQINVPIVQIALERLSTVDAVAVVRCGNCKHYFRPEYKDRGYCDFDDGLCGTVKNDSFCCYGERRGEE